MFLCKDYLNLRYIALILKRFLIVLTPLISAIYVRLS
nr:MAG TPA: Nrap protein domain 1 [Caudoviricetes sp.]DAX62627.1 MAG TPA: Nrap protein domain 1 [Caudoviricetes sp.]